MYRARLQTRVRGTNESLSELAQSINKLTRQSYPGADPHITNILSLDHFINAIADSDVRLRLREARPKDINEAEIVAIRLETHRLADRQENELVNKFHAHQTNTTVAPVQIQPKTITSQNEQCDNLAKELSSFKKEIGYLAKEIRNMARNNGQEHYFRPRNPGNVQNRYAGQRPFQGRLYGQNITNQQGNRGSMRNWDRWGQQENQTNLENQSSQENMKLSDSRVGDRQP